MLTTMVKAGVAIRGGVTWPSVYTLRAWLPPGQSSPVCWECPVSWEFNRCRPAPRGTRKVGFSRGGSTRMTSASSTIPCMAEADRIPEFNEVAVFLRRLASNGAGSSEARETAHR